MMSPSSVQFAEYEEFSKRELPRLVRTELEKLVSTEMQPLEESLKSRLVDLIRECQQSISDKFKAAHTASQPAQTYATLSSETTGGTMPLLRNSELSNERAAKNVPDQSLCSLAAPTIQPQIQVAEPILSEDLQPWTMFSPAPPLEHFALQQNMDFPLPDNVHGGEYSDSGYATFCMCNSSVQSSAEFGSSNQDEEHGQQNSAASNNSCIDTSIAGSRVNTESSFSGGPKQFEFMFLKCERCGGDKGEWMNTSISFDPNVSADGEPL